MQEKFSTVLLQSPHKLSSFSFRRKSVGFIIVWTFVIKIGSFGKKLLACLAKLQFTCSNVEIEEKFAIGRKSNLLDFGRCPSGLEPIPFGRLAKNYPQCSQKCNIQRQRNNMRARSFEKNHLSSVFFRTPGKSFELTEKTLFCRSKKLDSTSPDEHFEVRNNIGNFFFDF